MPDGLENREPLVFVDGVTKRFDVSRPLLQRLLKGEGRRTLQAVEDVSFEIRSGRTFALVGESGCGKSTLARLAAGLHVPSSGRVVFDQVLISDPRNRAEIRKARPGMQMVFQDPYASLNPRWRIADIVAEPIRTHALVTGKAAVRSRVDELLRVVRLSPADGRKFPHQFSGGQRQRISIARALATNPKFVICDEPTSALDVSVQAQILNLMRELQADFGLSYLLISHNLAVVSQMADQMAVMYLGRFVETGPAETIFAEPRHPYTRLLLETLPDVSRPGRRRVPLGGEVPNPIDPPSGCAFHPRCPHATATCRRVAPKLERHGGVTVACHAVSEGRLPAGSPPLKVPAQ